MQTKGAYAPSSKGVLMQKSLQNHKPDVPSGKSAHCRTERDEAATQGLTLGAEGGT